MHASKPEVPFLYIYIQKYYHRYIENVTWLCLAEEEIYGKKMEAISVFIIRIVELWYALTVEY